MGVNAFCLPTRGEFDIAFNLPVASLIEQNAIDFVVQVGSSTSEVQKILDCPATLKLVINAQGDPELMKEEDLAVLEIAILAAFDKWLAQSCDPEFKNVVNVSSASIGDAVTVKNRAQRDLQLFKDNNFTGSSNFFTFFLLLELSAFGLASALF